MVVFLRSCDLFQNALPKRTESAGVLIILTTTDVVEALGVVEALLYPWYN